MSSHIDNYLGIIKVILGEIKEIIKGIEDDLGYEKLCENYLKGLGALAYPFGDIQRSSRRVLALAKAESLHHILYGVLESIPIDTFSNEELMSFMGPGEDFAGGIKEGFSRLSKDGYFFPFYEVLERKISFLDREAVKRKLSQNDIFKFWQAKWAAERKPVDPIAQYLG